MGSYSKGKGRSSSDGGYFALPKDVLRHSNFINLSPYAIKLLTDIGEQYRGKNNGDLCATWSFMVKRGWKSKETLNNSLKELQYYGFIAPTQYGGLNKPTLYAVTWRKIDKVSNEFDYKVSDKLNLWHTTKQKFINDSSKKRCNRKKTQVRLTGQLGTAHGAVSEKMRVIK